jgi:hypothetical protein
MYITACSEAMGIESILTFLQLNSCSMSTSVFFNLKSLYHSCETGGRGSDSLVAVSAASKPFILVHHIYEFKESSD